MQELTKAAKSTGYFCTSCSRRHQATKPAKGYTTRISTATCPCGTWLELQVELAGSGLFRTQILRSRASHGLKATAANYSHY